MGRVAFSSRFLCVLLSMLRFVKWENVSIIIVNTEYCVLTRKGLYTWCVLFDAGLLEEIVNLSTVDVWDKVALNSLTTPSDQYGMVLCDN